MCLCVCFVIRFAFVPTEPSFRSTGVEKGLQGIKRRRRGK